MDTGDQRSASGMRQSGGESTIPILCAFFYNGKHKKQQQKGIVHRGVWLHLEVSGSGFYCEEAIISEDAFELR